MTADDKLAAILAAVQTDPGGRGLGRVPGNNLFTACPGDFAAACRSIADHPTPRPQLITGFYIPSADPPAFETDGPLGAVFLARAFFPLNIATYLNGEGACWRALRQGLTAAGLARPKPDLSAAASPDRLTVVIVPTADSSYGFKVTHNIAIERVGPAADGRCYTMRGIDVTDRMVPVEKYFAPRPDIPSVGIGDGGNEIGMGKVPHETVVANIPNGDRIHCRVATDHLIVSGVSNWGAYALAAGVYVLRGAKPPADLFDPARECEILETMVREGPLVDGVTGKQTPTVDGLSWDDYVRPLVRIGEIVKS